MRLLSFMLSFIIALTVTVTPANASSQFPDVTGNHWAIEEINFLSNQEIIKGFEDNTFRPNQTVTRADAAIMIARALELDPTKATTATFQDVSEDFYAYGAINAVAAQGIIEGFGGNYSPRSPLTRGQMAAILERAFDFSGTSDLEFRDIQPNHLFYADIQALVANKITVGYPDGTFKAGNAMKRAEFSAFLARALDERFRESVQIKPVTPELEEITQFEQQVLDLTNAEREKRGLSPLQLDEETQKVARSKSEDMRDQQYFAHTSPTYGSPFEMMSEFGITYRTAGENIAAGQTSASEVVEDWMNSEGHRKNILNPDYTHLGVGYAKGGSMQHYWTQMFIGR